MEFCQIFMHTIISFPWQKKIKVLASVKCNKSNYCNMSEHTYIRPLCLLKYVYLFSLETADFSHTQIINESLMFQEFDIPSMSNNFELDKSSSIEFPI